MVSFFILFSPAPINTLSILVVLFCSFLYQPYIL